MKITLTKYYLFLFFILSQYWAFTQSTTLTTSGTATSLWSTTTVSGLTFGIKNTNPYPIKITNLATYCPATAVTYTLFYNPTLINGAPGALSTTNGWIQIGSPSTVTPSVVGVTQIFSGLNFIIPANTTYRMGIQTSNNGPYYYTAGNSADFFTAGGVELYTQANPLSQSYTGPVTGLTTTPRGFAGSITFEIANRGFNDASISQLVSARKFCSASQDLSVKVANRGLNAISNVMINWDVDGITQTPVSLVTLLDTLSHPTNKSDTNITLGTITYTPNVQRLINVWTSMPNGVIDTLTSNDTLRVILQPGLSGTYTIGNVLSDFTSFRTAVGKLDSFGRCGPLVFNVTAGTAFTEQPVSITNLDSVTFQKFGVGVNPIVYGVRGNNTATDAVFRISGSKNIVFDGIDVADSVSNIANNERMEYGYAIINSSATNGSSNNTIRNCKITLNRANTLSVGILQSASTTGGGVAATSLAGGNHNNQYENVKIENVYKGISLIGTAAFPDSNCIVTSTGLDTTIIGANAPNDIGNSTALVFGISAANQKNAEISKCLVRNLTHTGTSTNQGIFIENTSTSVDYGTARVWGNTVHSINRITTTSATGTVHGIRIDVSNTAAARVWNNVVYDINTISTPATASANQIVRGISHGTAGTGNAEFYFNSVSINSPGLNNSSAVFWKGGAGTAIVRNNILSNASPAQTGVAKHFGTYLNAGNIIASNNVYWTPNANGFVGFVTSDRATLATFAAATTTAAPSDGNEAGSAYVNPNFASATDLNFSAATPAANSGMPITSTLSITTDVLGNTRSTTNPSVGAFETAQSLIDSAAPVISNIIIINTSSPIIRATITDNANPSIAGNVQLWYRLGSTGLFTPVAPDSVPVGTMSGVYRWATSLGSLAAGSYQFFIAARDLTGQGLNIAVNPIQAATFTGFASTDPVNYLNNPDASVNTRTFVKTAILAGGTYSVGTSSAPFVKLTDVANRLNSSELTGNVIFELQADYDGTTGETFPITFNQVVTTGGNWTVTIRPAVGVTNRETSGYPASTIPIIDLNGVDRLTLDGRPGGVGTSNEWTIRSKRTAGSQNSPSIQFINGAQRNSVTNLKIESDNTNATSGAVLISNTAFNDGNSFNSLLNCFISNRTDSTGSLAVGVYAAGTAGFTNDSNVISGNNIFNWTTSGVQATSTGNGANWRITNNHFYMTAAATTSQTAIRFEAGTAGGGTRINGNFIGGSTVNAGGLPWTNSVAGIWRGIVCAASLIDSVQVQNNTVQNINLTGGAGTYAAIEMTGALASIRNNTIGHATNANSIQTSQLGTIISIWLNNANNQALVEGNLIANINSTGTTTAIGHNGIRVTTGVTAAPLMIRNNSIYNLTAANPTTATTTASMVGILSLYAGTQQTIERNTIYGLRNSANAATNIYGINVTNASGIGTINANHIYDLNNTSATAAAQVVGIHLDLGSAWNVTNNMVALGTGVDSLAIVTGIQDKTAGNNHNISFNTVLITGNALSAAATNSHAFRRTTGSTLHIRNNIFQNSRTGGTGNYAIANTFTTPTTGWRANFNALNTANSAQLGLWNTTTTDFATWKTTSLFDTASINDAASFVSVTDLHLIAPTVGNLLFAGTPIAGIATDFDGQTRSASFPYMGADENLSSPLPVNLLTFTARKANSNDVLLNWTTASEKNVAYFEVFVSTDGKNFKSLNKVKAAGNSEVMQNYRFVDRNALQVSAKQLYYKLHMVDVNGAADWSNIAIIDVNGHDATDVVVYPNPFDNNINIKVTENTDVLVEITTLEGVLVLTKNYNNHQGTIEINNLNINSGMYIISTTQNGVRTTQKLMKQ